MPRTSSAALSCRAFVAELAALAAAARTARSLPERRRALARGLVHRFVPRVAVLGFDLRRLIIGSRNLPGTARLRAPRRVHGFLPELVAGGQDGEALRHIAAAAACRLVRRDLLRVAADIVDRLQGVWRGNPRESAAELAGNRTGTAVGRDLDAFLRGTDGRATLVRKLHSRLCVRPTPSSRDHRRRSKSRRSSRNTQQSSAPKRRRSTRRKPSRS